MSELILSEGATPSTPSSGKVKIFAPTQTVPTLGILDDAGLLGKIAINGAFTLTVGATGTAALISSAAWTPSIAGDVTPGTHTYTTRVGNYVKVGTFVVAHFYIVLNAKDGATSGDLLITGLPFASKNTAGLFQGGSVPHWGTLATSVIHLGIYTLPNTTTATLRKTTAAAASTVAMVAADIQNASSLLGVCIYEATA